MLNCAYDIETADNEQANEYFAKVHVKAPTNYKDEEKIKKYIENQRSILSKKAALSWFTGRVISYAIVDIDNPKTVRYGFDIDEKKLLTKFNADMADVSTLWGMNNKSFDNPFLVGRLLVNNLPIPQALKQRANDINDFFGWSSQSSQRGKLSDYLFAFGIKEKPMDGSQVPVLFNNIIHALMSKNIEEAKSLKKKLKDYNIFDAKAVASIVRRYEQ